MSRGNYFCLKVAGLSMKSFYEKLFELFWKMHLWLSPFILFSYIILIISILSNQ